jgi:hypothetical protein
LYGLIRRKDVIEAAVFTDDHDDVFDGCGGIVVSGLLSVQRRGAYELQKRKGCHPHAQARRGIGCNLFN